MLLGLILSILLGLLAGTFTGLFPGIHINLVSAFLVSLSTSSFLGVLNPLFLMTFVVAMATTHTFLDFIPSVFLGCPNTDTELAILPGHEMLRKGKGHEAVALTAYGGLAAVIIIGMIAFPLTFLVKTTYPLIEKAIPYILIIASIILISTENKKIRAIFVFLLTGTLGVIILNPNNLFNVGLNINQPLLPLLTGLFGASSLILSIKTKVHIPKQEITKPHEKLTRPLIGAMIASPLCGFLPGLGSGQAAILGNTISKSDKKGFLVLLGATNTLVMAFSFIALYSISKVRTGAAAAVKDLIGNPNWKILTLILLVIIITGIGSFFLTLKLSKFFSQRINKINYTRLSLITLLTLIVLVIFISGFIGLLILIASTLTGIYSINQGVKRTLMMSCLLVPTIVIYLT